MIKVERDAASTRIILHNPEQNHELIIDIWPTACWFVAVPQEGLSFSVEMSRTDVARMVQALQEALST